MSGSADKETRIIKNQKDAQIKKFINKGGRKYALPDFNALLKKAAGGVKPNNKDKK